MKKILIVGLVLISLFLSGCDVTDYNNDPDQDLLMLWNINEQFPFKAGVSFKIGEINNVSSIEIPEAYIPAKDKFVSEDLDYSLEGIDLNKLGHYVIEVNYTDKEGNVYYPLDFNVDIVQELPSMMGNLPEITEGENVVFSFMILNPDDIYVQVLLMDENQEIFDFSDSYTSRDAIDTYELSIPNTSKSNKYVSVMIFEDEVGSSVIEFDNGITSNIENQLALYVLNFDGVGN